MNLIESTEAVSAVPTVAIIGDVAAYRVATLSPRTQADVVNSLQFAALVATREAGSPSDWLPQLVRALENIGWVVQTSGSLSSQQIDLVAVCRASGDDPVAIEIDVYDAAHLPARLRPAYSLTLDEAVFSGVREQLAQRLGAAAYPVPGSGS